MSGECVDQERLLATFLDLVRIDSPSREEAACGAYCARALEDAGCVVRFDDSAESTGSDTGNLIATLPGTAPGTLLLSAHLDTVEPGRGVDPVIIDGLVVAAGETVLGADDKAGLAAAIECVRVLASSGAPRPTVRVAFTVQEEVGLCGAKRLTAEDIAADLCLVLDADGEPGGIVIAAPTHYTFAATFTGKAAHAGVAPEQGISAIRMVADAIGRMRLGRLDASSTANVGRIEGGSATNVVAACASLTGECRSRGRDRVEQIRAEMDTAMRTAARDAGGTAEVEWHLEYEGFALDAGDPLVIGVAEAVRECGLEPRTFATGGGSDANVIAAAGVPTVALACGMKGVHSTSEQIEVVHLAELARLCVAVARAFSPGSAIGRYIEGTD